MNYYRVKEISKAKYRDDSGAFFSIHETKNEIINPIQENLLVGETIEEAMEYFGLERVSDNM